MSNSVRSSYKNVKREVKPSRRVRSYRAKAIVNQAKPKLVSFKRKKGSSKYKGVLFVRKQKKWRAQICYKGKKIYIGSFATEVEAALARDDKVRELFGHSNQRSLNFPNRPILPPRVSPIEITPPSPNNYWSWAKQIPSPSYYYWQEVWNKEAPPVMTHLAAEADWFNFNNDPLSFESLTDDTGEEDEKIISPRVFKPKF